MTREETARKFAEAMGLEYAKDGVFVTVLGPNDEQEWKPLPAPTDPLHLHLEFVGHVAEAVGATGMGVEFWPNWSPTVMIEMPGRSRHTASASDLSWAAMLAALAAKGDK